MRQIPLILIVALLSGCAADAPPKSEPATATSAPTPAPVATASKKDDRDWLLQFGTRYNAVKAASRGDDVAALLREAEAANALAPDVPTVRYLLAVAQALSAKPDAAFATLSRMADSGLATPVATAAPFASLHDDPRFGELVARFEANAAPRGVIDLAFTAKGLPGDFIPESIVRDAAHDRWLLGSVHQRRIDAVDDHGGAYDFVADASGGLLSALGMQLIGDTLWVASSGFNESGVVEKSEIGRAGLFEIDANSGNVRKSWWLPDDSATHALGDVLILGSDIYTSDSIGGGVYRLGAERESLEAVIEPGLLLSPQGMAALDDERIVIADYPTGLWTIQRTSGAIYRLRSNSAAALTGLDGLYEHHGDLIAIQNGTSPKRILRIHLNDVKTAIDRVEVLAQNLLGWGEPSLATIHDGALYYIANSQWDRFEANGQLPPADQLEAPRIMRLRLD